MLSIDLEIKNNPCDVPRRPDRKGNMYEDQRPDAESMACGAGIVTASRGIESHKGVPPLRADQRSTVALTLPALAGTTQLCHARCAEKRVTSKNKACAVALTRSPRAGVGSKDKEATTSKSRSKEPAYLVCIQNCLMAS